jgi:flagellar motor switch protein FliN
MASDHTAEARQWLLTRWAAHLGEALSGMTGEKTEVHCLDATPAPEGLLWAQELKDFEGTDWFVAAPEAVWQAIGARVLEMAGLPETTPDDQRGTFLEVLSQSLSSLAQEAGQRLGRELVLGKGAEAPEMPPGLVWMGAGVEITPGTALPPLAVAFSESFAKRFAPREEEAVAAAAAAGAGSASHAARSAAAPTGRTFDLLMEVELPVSVSFGRNQMKLKELVKLNTGAIVELNRSVTEPVEVIVNNCVIARGEVVVVEGNYGVRIRQIVSREERLRTLF